MHVPRESRRDIVQHLANNAGEMHNLRVEAALERVYMDRQPSHGVPVQDLPALYDFVAKTIGDVSLIYLEFGVASGLSLTRMTERFPHPDARFYGFDSFEGLPEDWVSIPKGSFSMNGSPPPCLDPRVTFIEGWFQNSLPPFLAKHELDPECPVLVHFDADLYTATLFILASLWPICRSYYFIFDEFLSEEIFALDDFTRSFPVDIEFFSQTGAGGYPGQIFGKMTRVAYRR